MAKIKSTPEQKEKFSEFYTAKELYFQARAIVDVLQDHKKAFRASPAIRSLATALESAVNETPRDEAKVDALIEQDVTLDCQWDEDHNYWGSIDLLRQSEENLFDRALECMDLTGHGATLRAGGINKEMFTRAKLTSLFNHYPELINLCARFDPCM